MLMKCSEEIQALLPDAVRIRRELHEIPEIGFELYRTQAYVLEKLAACRPDYLRKIASTGAKAVFYAEKPEGTIAFRADMDALAGEEDSRESWRSQNPGRMHACGHDGHMTVLLLLARLLSAHRKELRQNVVLLFQPGEEGWAGARRMIEEGALENPKVDRIYGLHLWPTVPFGKLGVRWGPMMAQTSDFSITVHGKSAHASTPQMGIDAVVVAAELITMLQSVITRSVDPHQDALLTLGKIDGGTAHNIIADKVVLRGTLRTFTDELSDDLARRIRALTSGLETATGARFELDRQAQYPCVDNPRPLVEEFYGYLDSMDDAWLVEPVMAAEDFAEYQRHVPGLFFFLGVNGGRGGNPLHSCNFDFDEEALLPGLEVYRRILGIGG
jgi:amidohydrolase